MSEEKEVLIPASVAFAVYQKINNIHITTEGFAIGELKEPTPEMFKQLETWASEAKTLIKPYIK